MRILVRFRADGRRYAVDVASVTGVLATEEVEPLPAPRPGVLGVLRPQDEALTVIAPFGATGEHVLVLLGGDGRFGIVVDEVERVTRVHDDEIGPPPAGQDTEIVTGIAGDAMVLDAALLHRRLGPA